MSKFVKVKKISKVMIWLAVVTVAISAGSYLLLRNKVSADWTCGVPDFKQTDSDWASEPYGLDEDGNKTTIGAAGCGPTAIADVITAWGQFVNPRVYITPKDAAYYCVENDYRINGQGTSPDCILSLALTKGFKMTKLTGEDSVKHALAKGFPAIVLLGPGPDGKYTSEGHYLVLTKLLYTNDNPPQAYVAINDPNSDIESDWFTNIYSKYKKNGFWFVYLTDANSPTS